MAEQPETEDGQEADAYMAEAVEEEQEGSDTEPAEDEDGYQAQEYGEEYKEEAQDMDDYQNDVYGNGAAEGDAGEHTVCTLAGQSISDLLEVRFMGGLT